jgi:hypothetical protein
MASAMLPEGTTSFLLVGGIALASWLLLRGSRARWAKSQRASADPKEVRRSLAEPSRDSALNDAPPEVLRWHVELHATARDLKAEIDSKLSALTALTAIARQESDRLERLLKEANDRQSQ